MSVFTLKARGDIREEMAELVADGVSVEVAGGALGLSPERASRLWGEIVSGLGVQAA